MTTTAPRYDENVAELALLEWLGELGWQVLHVVLGTKDRESNPSELGFRAPN